MALKLTQLAAKPQLIKITLNTKDILDKYEDELEFYIYDRQPLDTFIKIATEMSDNYSNALTMIKDLILDEQGQPVIRDGLVLPADVTQAAIQQVIEYLGK